MELVPYSGFLRCVVLSDSLQVMAGDKYRDQKKDRDSEIGENPEPEYCTREVRRIYCRGGLHNGLPKVPGSNFPAQWADSPLSCSHEQCWGAVTFWCRSGSADKQLLLMDPVPVLDRDPAPTPDPTPFFSDFKDANKFFLSLFFFIIYLQGHYLQS